MGHSHFLFPCSKIPLQIDIMSLTVDLKTPASGAYKQPIGLFINNEWVEGVDKKKFETINLHRGGHHLRLRGHREGCRPGCQGCPCGVRGRMAPDYPCCPRSAPQQARRPDREEH